MAISDRARDFWDRISPRERVLVIVAAIAAPITIAVWLGMTISDGLSAMDARNDRTRDALKLVEQQRGKPIVKQTEVEQPPTDPIPLETYVNNAATTAGFSLKGTSPRPSVTKNGFITSSVSFQLEDLDIDKLKAFLQEVETKSKFVIVTHLDLKRDFRDKKKLDASVEVSTYAREKTEEEKAKDKDQGEGGGGNGSDKKGG